MQRALRKVLPSSIFYHYRNGVYTPGLPSVIWGSIRGITGDLSGITGDLTDITGDLTDITGDLSGITGHLTGITGNLTGIRGNLDACGLTAEERERGVSIEELIMYDILPASK